MRSVLILAILALFFASCHNEVPDLPKEVKYCGYKDKDDEYKCKSTYEMFKDPGECEHIIGGVIYDDKVSCETAPSSSSFTIFAQ